MKKWIIFIFGIFIIASVVISVLFVRETFFITGDANKDSIEVVITPGSNVKKISEELKRVGLVSHPLFFKWFVTMSHTSIKLQAGTFSFLPNSSITSIVFTLINPKNSEIQITIPEGFTKAQIKEKLMTVFPDFDQIVWDVETKNLEGYLFPDTYRLAKTATVKDIIVKMQLTLNRRLSENNIVLSTPHDTLTLASIVEKEVKSPNDMKRVAGVLFNRLKIGMALQVDSTLTYVNQKTSAQLTTEDLKSASLYNTYTHKGLPPTPISNPGMNAILAVMHPTASNDLYFLTRSDGTAVFARTHAEHVRNKEKYLP